MATTVKINDANAEPGRVVVEQATVDNKGNPAMRRWSVTAGQVEKHADTFQKVAGCTAGDLSAMADYANEATKQANS